MKLCNLCPEKHFARGYCRLHYTRWFRHGNPFAVRPPSYKPRLRGCTYPCCPNEHKGHGFCDSHLAQIRKHGRVGKLLGPHGRVQS